MRRRRAVVPRARGGAGSDLERLLDGGDRRSIGQVSRAVRRARRDVSVVADLVAALRSRRPLVCLRAADALEKISRGGTDVIAPYRRQLMHAVVRTKDPVVRWNLIQVLPRLDHDREAMVRLARRMEVWFLSDASAIVRVAALEAVVEFGKRNPSLEALARRMVSDGLTAPSAAVRARARRIERSKRI